MNPIKIMEIVGGCVILFALAFIKPKRVYRYLFKSYAAKIPVLGTEITVNDIELYFKEQNLYHLLCNMGIGKPIFISENIKFGLAPYIVIVFSTKHDATYFELVCGEEKLIKHLTKIGHIPLRGDDINWEIL